MAGENAALLGRLFGYFNEKDSAVISQHMAAEGWRGLRRGCGSRTGGSRR
jgi:hypothetical protein